MPVKKPLVTAWSYSRWSTYRTCPRQFRYKVIDRLPEPPSPVLERGIAIHTALEKFVRGSLTKLPADVRHVSTNLRKYKRIGADPEVEVCFNSKWERTGWFDHDAWLRIKIDLKCVVDERVELIDHKTGKVNPERHTEQLELYALAALLTVPERDVASTGVWYVDHEDRPRWLALYERSAATIRREKARWRATIKPMMTDRTFKPKPGYPCRWCAYSKTKGGPCEAG